MPLIGSAAKAGQAESSAAGAQRSTIAAVSGEVPLEVPEKSRKLNGNSGGQAVAPIFMQPKTRSPPAPSLVEMGIGYVPFDPAGTLADVTMTLAQFVMTPVAQQLTNVSVLLLMLINAVKKPYSAVLYAEGQRPFNTMQPPTRPAVSLRNVTG